MKTLSDAEREALVVKDFNPQQTEATLIEAGLPHTMPLKFDLRDMFKSGFDVALYRRVWINSIPDEYRTHKDSAFEYWIIPQSYSLHHEGELEDHVVHGDDPQEIINHIEAMAALKAIS